MMSSVPLSDGCKSPMKMHGTSSCGCASSVRTSIESKRRLLSQAVAVVTTCDNFFRSSLLFLLVTCDHGFTDGQGTAGGLRKSCAVDASSRHRDPAF